MEGWLPFSGGLAIFLTVFVLIDGAHREHKVHNIVLYPDKHSWCQTLQIKQVISYPGCKSEEIDNNVCVGACFSYSIPHTEPSDPGEVIVPYCDSCQPSDTTWHHVTLQCEKNSHETPPQLVKRVQIINNCSCSSCEKNHHRITHHDLDSDDPDDFLTMQQKEVPDLLKILSSRNETNAVAMDRAHAANMKSIVNHQIVTLLQNIQEKNSQYDKEQLIELLHTIQGPDQHKLSDKTIADFVESLNSENIELDLTRLREVLAKFEHSKYFEKHRKYLDSSNDDSVENRPLTAASIDPKSMELDQQYRHHHADPDDSLSIKDKTVLIASDHHRLSPAHAPNDQEHHHTVTSAAATVIVGGGGGIKPSSHHSPHHHHHVGEQVLGHGHLTKGPNGALVIEHDRIHEKLDVNPHELKPNHVGTLLTYSGQLIVDKPKSVHDANDDDDDDEEGTTL